MTFNEFKVICERCAAAAPSCAGWTLTFNSEDFEREWYVTARSGTWGAMMHMTSASATPGLVPDVVAQLGKMLDELRTGRVDASDVRRRILAELASAQS